MRIVRIVQCFLECINPSIISYAQIQKITRNPTDSRYNTSTALQLCTVVESYYLAKAVDNTSYIYHTLEDIANGTVDYWVSLMLLSIMCIFHKDIFTMYVALTNQLTSA